MSDYNDFESVCHRLAKTLILLNDADIAVYMISIVDGLGFDVAVQTCDAVIKVVEPRLGTVTAEVRQQGAELGNISVTIHIYEDGTDG